MNGRLERSSRNNAHAILSAEQWDHTIEALRRDCVWLRGIGAPEAEVQLAEGALRKMLAAQGPVTSVVDNGG